MLNIYEKKSLFIQYLIIKEKKLKKLQNNLYIYMGTNKQPTKTQPQKYPMNAKPVILFAFHFFF